MAVSETFVTWITDQLSEFGAIETKRMFGGVGLFKNGLMFGKIGGDIFRLKVDEYNRKDFEAYGMKPYFSAKKKRGMPYWEVPHEIIENKKELVKWAHKSYDAALRSKKL